MSSFNGTLSHAWATRPVEERYASTAAALDAALAIEAPCREVPYVDLRRQEVAAAPDGDLYLASAPGAPGFTHWSLSQFNSLVGGPDLRWLREMPAMVAASALNDTLKHGRRLDTGKSHKLYLRPDDGATLGTLRAITGNDYGRYPDSSMLRRLEEWNVRQGGAWKCPLPFKGGDAETNDKGTIYQGDRGLVGFLYRPDRPIDIGNGQTLSPGLLFGNSTVGNGTMFFERMLFSHVCVNYNIWDVHTKSAARERHTKFGPERFLREFLPMLEQDEDEAAEKTVRVVRMARETYPVEFKFQSEKSLADQVEEYLNKKGFTQTLSHDAVVAAQAGGPSGSDGRLSLWDMVQGLTFAAQRITHRDDRLDVERKAGALMAPVLARV